MAEMDRKREVMEATRDGMSEEQASPAASPSQITSPPPDLAPQTEAVPPLMSHWIEGEAPQEQGAKERPEGVEPDSSQSWLLRHLLAHGRLPDKARKEAEAFNRGNIPNVVKFDRATQGNYA